MARHASALKAARQAVKKNLANRQARAKLKTVVKNVRTAATQKLSNDDAKKALQTMLNDAQRTLMKAASKNLLKREAASRQIARLSKVVHKALSA